MTTTNDRTPVEGLGERVSAARDEVTARGETFYPGPSRIHLAAFPPKERWDDWVELDSRAWPKRVEKRYHARADDLLQLRVGVRPARLRRPRDRARSASSRATRSTRALAGATAPRGRRRSTRSTTPSGSCTRCGASGSAARAGGSRSTWDEALDDIAGRIRTRHRRGPPERGHVPRRPSRRGRLHRTGAGVVGRRRPQLAHQRLLQRRPRSGYALLDAASTARRPDHANAKFILLHLGHLETGHYFNPHAQRIMEAKANGAQAHRRRHPALEHRRPRRLLDLPRGPGTEAAMLLAIAHGLIASRGGTTGSSCERWWNWQEYLRAVATRSARTTFERVRCEVLSTLYAEYTPEYAAERSAGIDAAVDPRGRPSDRRERRHRPLDATSGATPQRATSAAGRSRARSVPRHVLPGAVGTAGRHRTSTRGTSSCRSRSYMPPPPAARGTSCSGRGSTRSRTTSCPSCCRTSSQEGRGTLDVVLHARLQPGLDQPRRDDRGSRCSRDERHASGCTRR